MSNSAPVREPQLNNHSTKHLFKCPMIRTSLTPWDLWSNPVAVADLLQVRTDTQGAAGGGARSGLNLTGIKVNKYI